MCKYVVWRSKGSIKSSVTFLRKSGTQDKSPESFGTVRNECEQVLKTFGRQSKNSLARDVVDSCPSVHELSQYCFPATAFDFCQFALGPARPCCQLHSRRDAQKSVGCLQTPIHSTRWSLALPPLREDVFMHKRPLGSG